jgi:hypothetical protein
MKYQSLTRQRIDDILQNLGKRSSLVDDADLATLMQLITVHIYERTNDLAQKINILEDKLNSSGVDGALLVKDAFINMFHSQPIAYEISDEIDDHHTSIVDSGTTMDEPFVPEEVVVVEEEEEEEMKLEEKQALEDGLAALHLYHDSAPLMITRSPSGNLSVGESTHSVPPADIFNQRDLPPIIGTQDFFDLIAEEDFHESNITHHS